VYGACCFAQMARKPVLTLFQLVRDNFYHCDSSISRDKA
jgi:hypothetical protein